MSSLQTRWIKNKQQKERFWRLPKLFQCGLLFRFWATFLRAVSVAHPAPPGLNREDSSHRSERVFRHFSIHANSSKLFVTILCSVSHFQLSFPCLEMRWNTFSRVYYILLNKVYEGEVGATSCFVTTSRCYLRISRYTRLELIRFQQIRNILFCRAQCRPLSVTHW